MSIHLPPGTRVGRYAVQKHLGGGAEGDVYSAVDHRGNTVILKQFKVSVVDPAQADELERAKRHDLLVGTHSPYACDVFDVFVAEGLLYAVMEFVPGATLENLLIMRGRLTLSETYSILDSVLGGLDHFHNLGIIHRDVKPSNIVVRDSTPASGAVLIDYGIALHTRKRRLTERGGFRGTAGYAAPEMLYSPDPEIGPETDIFAAGVTAFEMITGEHPFPGITSPISREDVERLTNPRRPSVRDIVLDVPEEIDAYVQRLMAVSPADRPATASQARHELETVMGGYASTPSPAAASSSRGTGRSDTAGSRVLSPAPPSLLIESGTHAGREIPVPTTGISLGRMSLNPVDGAISRFHVRVTPDPKGLRLRDLGSVNGLIYGERRLRKVLLRPGETVMVGTTVLRYAG